MKNTIARDGWFRAITVAEPLAIYYALYDKKTVHLINPLTGELTETGKRIFNDELVPEWLAPRRGRIGELLEQTPEYAQWNEERKALAWEK